MISNQCPLPVVFRGSVGVVALRVTVPEASSSMPQVLRDCPVTPLLRCDPRMGATGVGRNIRRDLIKTPSRRHWVSSYKRFRQVV